MQRNAFRKIMNEWKSQQKINFKITKKSSYVHNVIMSIT